MLTKYESFLLEKVKNELYLLLEGYIHGSTDFIFKIKELMKDTTSVGQIATCIYNTIDNERWFSDRDVKQNYFDLTDSDDKVSFIQNDKLPDDFDSDDTPSLPYEMSRNEIKIGRIVKYILKLNANNLGSTKFSDSDVEKFVNAFKASKVDNTMEFKLVSGDDISKYYNEKRYYNMSGSLGGSCMSDESKKIFKIYTKNPNKVKLLIYVDKDDKVHGRALVWKLDSSPVKCEYFMDRVYTSRDSDEIKFKKFAKDKEWMYKKLMNGHTDDSVKFVYRDQLVYGEISVDLDGDFSNYPFIDTLCFLSKRKNSLSNLSSKKCYFLHSVDGDRDRCDNCNGDIMDDDELCPDCSDGHMVLKRQGIETKWNKKVK